MEAFFARLQKVLEKWRPEVEYTKLDYTGCNEHGHAVLRSGTCFGLKRTASAGRLGGNLHCDNVEDQPLNQRSNASSVIWHLNDWLESEKISSLPPRSLLQDGSLPVAITLQSPFLNVEHQPFSEGEACARQTAGLLQPDIRYVSSVYVVVRTQTDKPIPLSSLVMEMPQTVAFLSYCKQ